MPPLPSRARALVTIASRFENIDLVQVAIDDLLQQQGLPEEDRHWIGLAVREAVANAIRHGNQRDTGKRVEVAATIRDRELVIAVRDEGEGFDPGAVRDPLAPDNLLRPSGRGIFYMTRLMDDVDYRFPEGNGGTEVVMRKRLGAGGDGDVGG